MHLVLLLVLVVLVVMFIRNGIKYKDTYEILQLKPPQLNATVLSERNPIVVEGKDIKRILDGPMSGMYIKKRVGATKPDALAQTNTARFAVFFHNSDDKAVVEIATPKHAKLSPDHDDYQTVSVVLRKDHVLILPPYWTYKVSGSQVATVFAHDAFSLAYDFVTFTLGR